MQYVESGVPEPGDEYLKPSEFLDFDHPAVRAFADRAVAKASTDVDKAVRLFYAVRDEIRYDPYRMSDDPATYGASDVLAKMAGFCIPKAVLLAATARASGIPAGIGLADVTNHMCSERLRRLMNGKELFLDHGYALMHIDGKWVKAAPAFDIGLCNKFDVTPTEFDGRSDALLQEFDLRGRKHMEYVADHGVWSDMPFQRVIDNYTGYYGAEMFERCAVEMERNRQKRAASFEDEKPLA